LKRLKKSWTGEATLRSGVGRPSVTSAHYPTPIRVPSNRESGGVEEDGFLFSIYYIASPLKLASDSLVSYQRPLIGLLRLSPTPSNAYDYLS
jgi:hypothetical protein